MDAHAHRARVAGRSADRAGDARSPPARPGAAGARGGRGRTARRVARRTLSSRCGAPPARRGRPANASACCRCSPYRRTWPSWPASRASGSARCSPRLVTGALGTAHRIVFVNLLARVAPTGSGRSPTNSSGSPATTSGHGLAASLADLARTRRADARRTGRRPLVSNPSGSSEGSTRRSERHRRRPAAARRSAVRGRARGARRASTIVSARRAGGCRPGRSSGT